MLRTDRTVRKAISRWKIRLTKLILRARLELLVCHQLFHASGDRLDVVYNQLVEIGVLFATFNEELIAEALAHNVRVWLSNVCE